jgi:hypothetical protein
MQRIGYLRLERAQDPRRIGGQGGAVRGGKGMCGCERLGAVNDHWDCRIGSADPVISRVFAHAERSWDARNPLPRPSPAPILRRGNPPPRQSPAVASLRRRDLPPVRSLTAPIVRRRNPAGPRPRWGFDPCRSLVHSRSRGGGGSVGVPRTLV